MKLIKKNNNKTSFVTCLKHCQRVLGEGQTVLFERIAEVSLYFVLFCSLALALFLREETKPFQILDCEETLILKLETSIVGSTFCFLCLKRPV